MSMLWWPFVVSAICAGILMPLTLRAHGYGHDAPGGVQKLHHIPTSRLGGIVVVVACSVTSAFVLDLGHGHWPQALPLVLAAVPVVLFGLAEDLTRRVRPRYRMLAAVAAGMLASAYAGGIVPRLDLPLVDDWLRNPWFVLPVTWFMVAGACNAMNLIDGAHGLAGGTALIMFGGIALAAGWSGDPTTFIEALVVMGALAGFLAWNYPRGRVFLGDAGAYFIGFMYAELSIQLIARNSGLSAWYVIMLAGYPIVEMLFSIYRRKMVHRTASMEADALHLHLLMFRRVVLPIERRQKRMSLRRANARVAPRLWLHSALCLAVALIFHDNTPALWIGLAAYAAFYVSQYRALVRFRGKRAWRWAVTADKAATRVKRPSVS